MGIIKDIYDATKNIAQNQIAISNIRNELRDEIKLNLQFLKSIDVGKGLPSERLKKITDNLQISEMIDFLVCPFPKSIISTRRVSQSVLGNIKAKYLLGQNLEETCRRIRHMIKYLKLDFDAAKDPKSTLLYIKKYFRVALKLL